MSPMKQALSFRVEVHSDHDLVILLNALRRATAILERLAVSSREGLAELRVITQDRDRLVRALDAFHMTHDLEGGEVEPIKEGETFRGKRWPEGCTCAAGFGMNLSCPVRLPGKLMCSPVTAPLQD